MEGGSVTDDAISEIRKRAIDRAAQICSRIPVVQKSADAAPTILDAVTGVCMELETALALIGKQTRLAALQERQIKRFVRASRKVTALKKTVAGLQQSAHHVAPFDPADWKIRLENTADQAARIASFGGFNGHR